jgi:hypothetical protein
MIQLSGSDFRFVESFSGSHLRQQLPQDWDRREKIIHRPQTSAAAITINSAVNSCQSMIRSLTLAARQVSASTMMRLI